MSKDVPSGAEASKEPPSEISKDSAPIPSVSAADAPPASKPRLQVFETIGAKMPRVSRFAQLAAVMTLAAGFGAFAGTFGAATMKEASAPPPVKTAQLDNKELAAKLSAEIAALKSGIESTARSANAQFAKLSERFEKAQAEPSAKLARIGEALEKLERRPPATVAAATTASSDITGSIPDKPAEKLQPMKPAIVAGWILRDIYDGLALVESRRGMVEVGPGSIIPGIGRVETIRKQDGRWVVVTAKGLIIPAR
ncbi:MAG: hypothetical protein AB7K04_10375 [Pseudorhodoplanes sp.]